MQIRQSVGGELGDGVKVFLRRGHLLELGEEGLALGAFGGIAGGLDGRKKAKLEKEEEEEKEEEGGRVRRGGVGGGCGKRGMNRTILSLHVYKRLVYI